MNLRRIVNVGESMGNRLVSQTHRLAVVRFEPKCTLGLERLVDRDPSPWQLYFSFILREKEAATSPTGPSPAPIFLTEQMVARGRQDTRSSLPAARSSGTTTRARPLRTKEQNHRLWRAPAASRYLAETPDKVGGGGGDFYMKKLVVMETLFGFLYEL